MQVLNTTGGKYFMGVNYCMLDKYTGPVTPEQWKTCVSNVKVGPFSKQPSC